MEPYAMLVANFADLSDRLYSTDLVVSCHYCNITDSVLDLLCSNKTLVTYRKICYLKAKLFEILTSVQNCMMFKCSCDDMLLAFFFSKLCTASYSPVVRLRAASREIDLVDLPRAFATCSLALRTAFAHSIPKEYILDGFPYSSVK